MVATDPLENIKARYPRLHPQTDTGWLVAEVERLRLRDTVLRQDMTELQAARITDFEVLADYCKKLHTTLRGIDPKNPAIESVRRVGQMVTRKLDALKGEKSGN